MIPNQFAKEIMLIQTALLEDRGTVLPTCCLNLRSKFSTHQLKSVPPGCQILQEPPRDNKQPDVLNTTVLIQDAEYVATVFAIAQPKNPPRV
jgi:hypothetical protein